jgi:hypothetical protein
MNRVAHPQAYDGDGARGMVSSADHSGSSHDNNDLDLAADQVVRQLGETLFVPLGIARIQDEVLALHPAQFMEAFAEGLEAGRDRDRCQRCRIAISPIMAQTHSP